MSTKRIILGAKVAGA